MASLAPVGGGSGKSGVDTAEAARRAEEARQKAEQARKAAEQARKAAEDARRAAETARRNAEAARQQKAAAEKAAADARKAAQKPGQTTGAVQQPKPGQTPGAVQRPKPGQTPGAVQQPKPGQTPGAVQQPRPGQTPGVEHKPTQGQPPQAEHEPAPGQTPEASSKSQAAIDAAEKNRQQATEKAAAAEKQLQAAEEKVALSAKRAQEAMLKANTLAVQEKKKPPFTQKDIDSVKPKKNELASAFDGTRRKAELEKLLGTKAPPKTRPEKGEKPPVSLDVVRPQDVQAASKLADGQSYTEPSSGAKYQVKKNAATGETVLSDAAGGHTVTIKSDGSYTSTVTTKSDGARESTWTKSTDARGRTTGLESRTSQTEQHPETGATRHTSTTRYDVSRTPPVPRSRTDEVQMEKPPAALAKRPGTPQGPTTAKTETHFNDQGLPTQQVKTTEVHTPGFKAADVSAFEAGQASALRNASQGEDHHRTNNAPASLKPGESSLTITEQTRFNAQGEPAVSTRKTESVATQALKTDTNGNGVQVARSEQVVTRGPANAPSTDALPALSPKTPGTVTQRTTVTGYDPDGSRFEAGHASRSRTVSQSSGTVDAHGQMQLKHQPTEVQSLNEASDNRWRYDHVGFEVGADGKPVPGQEPKQLDQERQLPWYEDAKDFAVDGLKDLADTAGEVADAASELVTAPLEDALTDEIKKLDSAGDTLTLSGNLDVKVGLKAGIAGEAAIERTDDGKYQLSAEVTGDVGVGLLGSASVSAGGRMEWTFNTPEEAAKASLMLGKGPAALVPGSEDNKFLMNHLSAVEVNAGAEVEAGIGGKFGPAEAELSVSAGATTGFRVEFDQGKPTHLVRTTEVEGSGAAGVASGLKGKAGVNVGGEVSGSVSIESRIPLDSSKVDAKDMLAFLASPASAAFAGPAETSISVEGSVDAGDQGQFFTAEVSGLSGEEAQSVAKKLLDGQGEKAFEGVKVEPKFTTGSFKDREAGFGAKLGVVDFEVSARHRDMTAEGGGGDGGTTVSLGGGKHRGDGTSGSHHGSGGGSGPAGHEGPSGTTKDGTPPPEYRVNPATGKLTPVTPGPAKSHSRPTEAKDGTGGTSGRRPVPVVRNPELPGRTTQVRYDDGKVRIEAGPDAKPEDIQAHLETARVLQRYEGAAGKVRQLIDKVKQVLTGMPGYGSQGFESRLEVKKLSGILASLEATQAELGKSIAGATGTPNPATKEQLADLERRIASVEGQLREHEAQVDSLASGRGYVAEEDDVTPAAADASSPLPSGVPSWVAKVLPPGIRPGDVSVQGSKVTTGVINPELDNPKPNTAYWVDNRYLYVTDDLGRVASVQGTLYKPSRQVRDETRQGAANKTGFLDGDGEPLLDANHKPDRVKYENDHGGHLIGAQFGGPPERINYVPQTHRQNTTPARTKHKPPPSTSPHGHPKDKGWARNWYEAEQGLAQYASGNTPVHVRITPRFVSRGTTRPDDLLLEMKLGGAPDGGFDDKQRYPN